MLSTCFKKHFYDFFSIEYPLGVPDNIEGDGDADSDGIADNEDADSDNDGKSCSPVN